jgi:glutamate carboxypeptidase
MVMRDGATLCHMRQECRVWLSEGHTAKDGAELTVCLVSTTIPTPPPVSALRARSRDMVDQLRRLVEAESPSNHPDGLRACADVLVELAAQLTGARAEKLETDGLTHLRWRFGGAPTVLLLGHYDTVWPWRTIDRLPFAERDGIVSGPGCFDMKAGLVQGLHAVAALGPGCPVELLVTADEEVGSASSRALIQEAARGKRAVLVLEPSHDGALKVERKGVGMYQLAFTGRAAHAGLAPETGANALLAMARAAPQLAALAEPALGTTVTPTVASAGSTSNVVPASASLTLDVRASSPAEFERVDGAIHGLASAIPGVSIAVNGGVNRPPMPNESARELFGLAVAAAADLGLAPLRGVSVGGGSDGNFTAGVGIPTLDGLGAVGGGAHADDEHVVVSGMPERAALVAALVARLTS